MKKWVFLLFLVFLVSACATRHNRQTRADAVMKHYQSNRDSVRNCYQKVLNESPAIAGKIVLEWTVNDEGRVTELGIKEKNFTNVKIEKCLLDHLRSLKFPAASQFTEVTVEYTYRFG